MVKKQIALALAGTAAAAAGGLRLIQELVERGDRHDTATGVSPAGQQMPTTPPAPSSSAPAPDSPSPGTPPEDAATGETPSTPAAATVKASPDASKAELYEIATTLDISGRSKMSKAELIEAINSAR